MVGVPIPIRLRADMSTPPRPSAPPTRDAHVFRDAGEATPLDIATLSAYLAGIGLPLDPVMQPRQFGTGLANINYRLRAGDRDLVLRRPPGGNLPPGAHDMAREHRILSRLWQALPLAPRSLHLCEDRVVIGVPFQLIEYRPGLVIKGDDRSRFEDRPDLARRMGQMLVETLVAIHGVDTSAIGLDGLGKPEGFVARGAQGWLGRAERLEIATVTALAREIGDWIVRQPLKDRRPILLHSDFKLDNLIVDPDTLAPVAIVDWDMGTRGDPLFDLATLLSYWVEPGDIAALHAIKQMPSAAPGFPTRAEVVAEYAKLTGTDVSDYPVLRVLCLMKLAVVLLQLHALWKRGAAKGHDYADLDRHGTDLLVLASDVAMGRAE